MSNQSVQSIQVLPVHSSLKSTIEQFLSTEKLSSIKMIGGGGGKGESTTILREAELFDFGVRLKLVAVQSKTGTVHTDLYVSIPEWKSCKEDASRRLRDIYKESFNPNFKTSPLKASPGPFDFRVNVNDAIRYFSSIEECAHSLAQIRVQCLGSSIYNAMEHLQKGPKEGRHSVHFIQSHTRIGECRCIGTDDKVLIIFTVRVEDEMEQALARVFLQQFVGAQKQISQSPHCEFKRGSEGFKELLPASSGDGTKESGDENDDDNVTGYLAFTFFQSHLKNPERLLKAVGLMVNFLPYLDKHLKSTKSFMHSRMRAKKNDLLRELKETIKPGEATSYGSLVAAKKKENKKFASIHRSSSSSSSSKPRYLVSAI